MKIAGIQKCSMVDYPGKMSAVVFTRGCNLDCYYCHNHWLIPDSDEALHREEDVMRFLERRVGRLDAVVVSGGEPTLQRDLEGFIRKVRDLGYPIKLDTNGTNPDVLRRLVDEGLLDYVAMDVKAPRERYQEICGAVDVDAVDASIQILLEGRVDYEFRTTLAPELTDSDIERIGVWILGARRHVLQQFRPLTADSLLGTSRADDTRTQARPLSAARVMEWVDTMTDAVMSCHTRGLGADATVNVSRLAAPASMRPPQCAWPRARHEAIRETAFGVA